MADENPNNHKKYGGPWIRCPSQSHGGKMYYFNKSTGKAVWELSDADMIKANLQTIPIEGPAVPCRPEPAEPPGAPSYSTVPDPSNQTIYNKQIINNRFAKPFAGPTFVSPQCHYIKVFPATIYNPDIWNVPPAPYYLSPVPALPANQIEPPQGNYVNRQRFNKFKPQWKQNLSANNYNQKFRNDLRQVLSSRRNDLMKEEGESWNTNNEQEIESTDDVCEEAMDITEDDLCPSDVDEEWLKANSAGESDTIDTSPIWRLDKGDAHPDYSFIIPTTAVLLNHLTFLSRIIKSDARLRLLAPGAELRRLRARTAGAAPRLPRRARAAVRFAALQMHKVPVNLKTLQDGNIESCCMELNKQRYLVILIMTDAEESENRYVFDDIPTFTISDLKECLAQPHCAPKTESRENVVTIISNELSTSTNLNDHKDICKDNSASASSEPVREHSSVDINQEFINDNNTVESKCVEIQKDQVTSYVKTTANASVQTDFEHNSTLSIESANSSTIVRTLETEQTLRVGAVIESSNDAKEEPKVATRKIKLNRSLAAPKTEPVKQTTVKWRKRRAEPPKTNVNPNITEETRTLSDKAFLMDVVRSDLIVQMNDDAVDGNNTQISEKNAHMEEKESNKESISVISNSVESEAMFRVNKRAILSQSVVNEEIHMFEVRDESMGEYLVMRRDEWVSRFVQIMEEALTQVLQCEPRREPAMPPPWSVHEATLCVKRTFENNTKIVFASDKLTTVLHQISDSKGKIKADLNPSEFMRMYSYGVNLIKHLQDLLNDSEDLHIAKTSLSKLLIDIQDPNQDVAHNTFIDTFDDEQTSNTELGMSVSDDTQPALESRAAPPPAASHQSSPSKYSLRSQQKKVTSLTITRPAVEDNCFFTSLRLKRNDSSDSASKTLNTGDQPSSPATTGPKPAEPKIIRQFNVCADFEERLKKKRLLEEVDDEYFAEDTPCVGTQSYLGEDAGLPAAADTMGAADDADDADARTVLKWFMSRTTYPIHRVLVEIQRFCTDTYKELNKNERLDPEYITMLSAKTTKVTLHMKNLCKYLNRILHRDTRSKFSYMLKQVGYEDAPMSPAQQAEYGAVVKRYLGQANVLLEAVTLLAEAARDAECSGIRGHLSMGTTLETRLYGSPTLF